MAITRPLPIRGWEAAIRDHERKLNGHGRLVIRPSGTEPVIRVMAEAEDAALVNQVLDEIIGVMTAVEGVVEA